MDVPIEEVEDAGGEPGQVPTTPLDAGTSAEMPQTKSQPMSYGPPPTTQPTAAEIMEPQHPTHETEAEDESQEPPTKALRRSDDMEDDDDREL